MPGGGRLSTLDSQHPSVQALVRACVGPREKVRADLPPALPCPVRLSVSLPRRTVSGPVDGSRLFVIRFARSIFCLWLLQSNDVLSRPKSVVSAAVGSPFVTPDLTKIQTVSYSAFLQDELPSDKRKDQGLESVLREIFPIESYDKQISLEYLELRSGQAALHARRMPPAAADLRPAVPRLAAAEQGRADRGRSLPGRPADHARRW